MVFNGEMKGDEEGEFTFTGGRGGTVIDLVLVGGQKGKGESRRIEGGGQNGVRKPTQSVEVCVKGGRERRREKGEKEKHLKIFDSTAYVSIPALHRKKFQPSTKKMIMVVAIRTTPSTKGIPWLQ